MLKKRILIFYLILFTSLILFPELIKEIKIDNSVVVSLSISPDGKYIVCGTLNNRIIIIETDTLKIIKELKGHERSISAVAYSPDNKLIVSCSNDGVIKIWDWKNEKCIKSFINAPRDWPDSIAFSPDGKFFVSASRYAKDYGTAKLWDVEKQKLLRTFNGSKPVIFSPNGKYIASGGGIGECTIIFWESKNCNKIKEFKRSPKIIYKTFAFSPNGKFLLSGALIDYGGRPPDGEIVLWDVQSGEYSAFPQNHYLGVYSVVFSPDEEYIVSGGDDDKIMIWEMKNRKLISTINFYGNPYSIACSSKGKYFLVGGDNMTAPGRTFRDSRDGVIRVYSFK